MVAKRIILYLALVCVSLHSVMNAETLSSGINDPRFKTMILSNPSDFMGLPVVRLNSDDILTLSFDEIADDYRNLRARIILCDADWTPSRLSEAEYADGFNFADIDDYAFSSNTFVHYVNYHLDFPRQDLRPLLSGNYVIQVFDRDNPDDIIMQSRFYVTEGDVPISASITSRTDRGADSEWQQLDITAVTGTNRRINPYSDLRMAVMQNRRPETIRFISNPLSATNETVRYAHNPALIFPASNEYRRFETVRADYPGMHADSARYEGSNYHAYLTPDTPRIHSPYSYDRTQKGRFLIREYNSTDSDLGADYVTVHFTLSAPYLPEYDIYIDGDFTNHAYGAFNRMVYNSDAGEYQLQIPLKQGSYNYQYTVMDKTRSGIPDTSILEGNKFETSNEYNIFLYSRSPGERYDRLLGVSTVSVN